MKPAFHILWFLLAIGLFFSCSQKQPKGVLLPKQMEDLLIDIHLSEGLMETDNTLFTKPADKEATMRTVLHKHGVTGVQFDSSLSWYGRNLETYVKIYNRVIARLTVENEQIKALIAGEQMQTLTLSGDTVDIWKSARSFVFSPEISSNILTFNIHVDENFRERDKFKLGMRFRIMPEELNVFPRVSLSLLNNDNKVSTMSRIVTDDGWVELELESNKEIYFSKVFGSLYLPLNQMNDNQAIFVDSIRLIRIHQPK